MEDYDAVYEFLESQQYLPGYTKNLFPERCLRRYVFLLCTLSALMRQVAVILQTPQTEIELRHVNVQCQIGGSDCRLFAIAFATALCAGIIHLLAALSKRRCIAIY